jgi:hypothetical protein
MPMPEPPSALPPPRSMSLVGRLVNVFAVPGEVFEEVKAAPPCTANWLVPALVLIVVSWLTSAVVLSQDFAQHQMTEAADRATQKQVEEQHLSEQDAERGRGWVLLMAKVSAAVVPPMIALSSPFVWGLVVWLAGAKMLKGGFPYMKAVEVVGLGNMILVLDALLRTLLILVTGNLFAAPSPTLLLKDYDPQNSLHAALSLLSVMTLWLLAVRAIGLSRLCGAGVAKSALWVYGVWAAYTGCLMGVGFGLKALAKKMVG